MEKETKLLSVSEFAQRIDVHPQTVRRWDRTGQLPAHLKTVGGQRKYTENQVNDYLNGKTVIHNTKN